MVPEKHNYVLPNWAFGGIITLFLALISGIVWVVIATTTMSTEIKSINEKLVSNTTNTTTIVDAKINGLSQRIDRVELRLDPLESSRITLEKSVIEMQSDIRYIRRAVEDNPTPRTVNQWVRQ